MADLYERQESLGVNRDQKVAIIGCGGVGSWIALFIGLAGVSDIDIYDADTVSIHNLNRFPLGPEAIGRGKAEAMAEHISRLRPGIAVTPRGMFNPELHSLDSCDWVVVSTDSLKSRRMVYDAVKGLGGVRYIECGAEGHHMTVTFEPPMFSTPDEENPGYQSVPVFVGPCTMAASIAAYHILLGGMAEVTYGAGWDGVIVDITRVNEADEPTAELELTSAGRESLSREGDDDEQS